MLITLPPLKLNFGCVACSCRLALFFLCHHLAAEAQVYNFRRYSVEDGLSQSQVYSVIQDRKGFLWMGTNGGGVNRFDGKNFKSFTTENGLCDNIIYAVYEDRAGNIWMGGADGGVSRFDGKQFQNFSTRNGLSDNRIYCVFQDSKGAIWLGTNKGISRFNGAAFTAFLPKKYNLPHHNFRSILEDKYGNLWFACAAGLVKYDGKTFTNFLMKGKVQSWDVAMGASLDKNGNIWMALFDRGVALFDGKNFKTFKAKEGFTNDPVFCVYNDPDGNLWYGTASEGVTRYNGKTHVAFTEKEGFSNLFTRCMMHDREGNFWLGTDEGIYRYDGGKFTSFFEQERRHHVIYSLLQDSKGAYWFGTESGVICYDGKTAKKYSVADGLANNRVFSMAEDRQGNLWMGTYGGVSKFDGKKFSSYTVKDGLADNIIFAMMCDPKGNMWFGTNEGICLLRSSPTMEIKNNLVVYQNRNNVEMDKIRVIFSDSRGNIWFGSRGGGISKFDGRQFTFYTVEDGLGNNVVNAIHEDRAGNIWIGTGGGGLVQYTPWHTSKKFIRFTTKDGLSDDAVMSLVSDDEGNLWIGTTKGIHKLELKEYKQTKKATFNYFGKEDGFSGVSVSANAAIKDDEGYLWFGTIRGATRVDVKKIRTNSVQPLTYINNLKIFYDEVNWNNYPNGGRYFESGLPVGLELPYHQNHLTFNYQAVSLTVPEKIAYRYKLQGLDKEWSPTTKETQATYSNLSPGRYTFLVKASNNDGIWSAVPAAYTFEMVPPFWKTWWFYLVCSIAGIVLILFISRAVMNNLNRKKKAQEDRLKQQIIQQKVITSAMLEAQEQERKRIAAELHDGLGQVFSAIKLNLSCLEPVIEKLDADKRNNFETSIHLLDGAVSELRSISHNMLPQYLNDFGLVAALEILCREMNQSSRLECNLIVSGIEGRLARPVEIALYRITQELLNNIVKHSKAREASVQLIRHDQSLMLMVEDDGIGFSKQKSSKERNGIGLENIRSRLLPLNGILDIDSQEGSGTSVTIEIPLTE